MEQSGISGLGLIKPKTSKEEIRNPETGSRVIQDSFYWYHIDVFTVLCFRKMPCRLTETVVNKQQSKYAVLKI